MRNIFDQYSQNENRLSHALASILQLDVDLRRSFMKEFIPAEGRPDASRVGVSEQSYPGQPSMAEEEAERRGLPDIWLFEDQGWCAVIECKITAPLLSDQIVRHCRLARRQDFKLIVPVAISILEPADALPSDVIQIRWTDIYVWLKAHASPRNWAELAARYFETLEVQMIENGQLDRGTLTTFSGFPFATLEDYSYGEAKRVLRLALDELAKDKRLEKEIGIDPMIPGRGAIKGRNSDNVWDVLQIKEASRATNHTSNVHLTLSITRRHVAAWTVVPYGLDPKIRQSFAKLSLEQFFDLLATLSTAMAPILAIVPLASPSIMVLQRRWLFRSKPPVTDCELIFDMRTALSGGAVKTQQEWAKAAHSALTAPKSNLEVLFGIVFPYDRCPEIRDQKAVDLISASWRSCTPIFNIGILLVRAGTYNPQALRSIKTSATAAFRASMAPK
ncbi:MAG: hypothetical protein U1E67_12655 [Hyphomicrobiales bacterium]